MKDEWVIQMEYKSLSDKIYEHMFKFSLFCKKMYLMFSITTFYSHELQ
jgi:hypothetical protein